MLYYSASTAGFYDDAVHSHRPDDCVVITAETHAALLAAQEEGLAIVAGPDGAPVARPHEVPDAAHLLAELRSQRNERLRASDFSQMPDVPLTSAEREAWRGYRQALRDLPETTDDPANIGWPDLPERT